MKEQKLTGQKELKSNVRKDSYLKYLNKYPLYSTLLILKEYEDKEMYEECSIIKKALDEYNEIKIKGVVNKKMPFEDITLPTHISTYKTDKFQNLLRKYGAEVDEKEAKEKAQLIKINLPIK